ncbi:MAG: hypothetical protein NTU61_00345 [Candidatus Altiarchaeota archaeon]|nr:hypothetical protein [Candidatus Altiarchaeota archaeon]
MSIRQQGPKGGPEVDATVEALNRMTEGGGMEAPQVQEPVALGKLSAKPVLAAKPLTTQFTGDEARLVRAMVFMVVGDKERAVQVLKDTGSVPAVTANIAEHYVKARAGYDAAKKKGGEEFKADRFYQARHELVQAVSEDQALHDRYFKHGDSKAAMNTLLSERANAELKRLSGLN